MKRILCIFALIIAATLVHATNAVYIAQTAAGSANGTSCANAYALTYFNTAGNWSATPTGTQIGPGSTVHLCGTFTGTAGQNGMLDILGSGTSGNPITILFEPGANATAPYWGNNGFIYAASTVNYITIDGGGTGSVPAGTFVPNGDIVASANGAALANHVAGSIAIAFRGTGDTGITVQNMQCENMFVAVQNNDTSNSQGKLLATLLAAIAEFERELIRERTGEGRKRAMAAGVKFGRKRKLSDFQRAEAVKRRSAGETLAAIAKTYGVAVSMISRL